MADTEMTPEEQEAAKVASEEGKEGEGKEWGDDKIAQEIVDMLAQMSTEWQTALFLELQNQYMSVQEEAKNSPEAQAAIKDEMMWIL